MSLKQMISRFEQMGYTIHTRLTGVVVMLKDYGKFTTGNLVFKNGKAATMQTPDVNRILNKKPVNIGKYS